jgi:hypothetical protein
MLAPGLFHLLSTESTIAALVGTRIYPVALPTGPTLPAIVYYSAGGTGDPTLDTSGLQKLRYTFDCWGETYAAADQVRDALVAFLNGYRGALSNGILLQMAEYIQPIDSFKDALRQYCCAVELYFLFDFPS